MSRQGELCCDLYHTLRPGVLRRQYLFSYFVSGTTDNEQSVAEQ